LQKIFGPPFVFDFGLFILMFSSGRVDSAVLPETTVVARVSVYLLRDRVIDSLGRLLSLGHKYARFCLLQALVRRLLRSFICRVEPVLTGFTCLYDLYK
jgi:hypothetical protein